MKMKSITSWLVAAATATVMVGCASTADNRGKLSDTHPASIGGTEVTAAELHDDLQSAKKGTTVGGPGTHFGPDGKTLVTTTSSTAEVTMTTTPDQPLVEREVVVEREIVEVPAEPRTEVVIIEREPVDLRAELDVDVDDDDDDDEEVTTTRTMLRKD